MIFNRSKKTLLVLVILFALFPIGVLIYYFCCSTSKDISEDNPFVSDNFTNQIEEVDYGSSDVLRAGKSFSNDNCSGVGSITLTHEPMDLADFSHIEPYGLMIGAHVTPIDHQYFSPADYNSPRDSYEVYAMADGKIIDIQNRVGESTNEFRLVFMHSCTFYTYFDLVTSLTPELKAEFDKNQNNNYARTNFSVKAGDLIGWIGAQTLDFAVWDLEKPLTGFVVPEHYKSEKWKIYTANPFNYYSTNLTQMFMPKYLRVDEPIEGKIDYDIDGKLVGNWFVEGTNGYAGNPPDYWKTHLSIVPNHLDPNAIIFSTGNYNGEAGQFTVQGNTPNPADVSVSSGIVRYNLVNYTYKTQTGGYWDRMSPEKDLILVEGQELFGSVLLQLLEDRKLKVEIFPNANFDESLEFTENAVVYER